MREIFEYLFLAGIVAQEVIRFPFRMRNKQDRRQKRMEVTRIEAAELAVSALGFIGLEVLPFLYVFTSWLDFADYDLPDWAGWVGAVLFAAALWILWRAHADLGRNWSPTLEITKGQSLVTQGIYHYLRHPIYASLWLVAIAQALMLQNWIAGLAGLAATLLVQVLRVPREEKMMLEHFGEDYRAYMEHTGGVIPRLVR